MAYWRKRYQPLSTGGILGNDPRLAKQTLILLNEAEKTDIKSTRFAEIIEDIYNVVLTYTEAEDAWYEYVVQVFHDLCAACGLNLDQHQRDEIEAWVTTYCHSWVEPEGEEEAIFLDGLSRKIRRFALPTPKADHLLSEYFAGIIPNTITDWLALVERLLQDRPTELHNLRLGCYCANDIGFSATLVGKDPVHEQPWHGSLFIEGGPAGRTHIFITGDPNAKKPANDAMQATSWQMDAGGQWPRLPEKAMLSGDKPTPTAVPTTVQMSHNGATWAALNVDLSPFDFSQAAPHFPETTPVFGIALFEVVRRSPMPLDRARGLFLEPVTFLWRQTRRENHYIVTLDNLEKGDYRVVLRCDNLYHPTWGYGSWLSEPCDFLVRDKEILPWPKGRQKTFLAWPWGNLKRTPIR